MAGLRCYGGTIDINHVVKRCTGIVLILLCLVLFFHTHLGMHHIFISVNWFCFLGVSFFKILPQLFVFPIRESLPFLGGADRLSRPNQKIP